MAEKDGHFEMVKPLFCLVIKSTNNKNRISTNAPIDSCLHDIDAKKKNFKICLLVTCFSRSLLEDEYPWHRVGSWCASSHVPELQTIEWFIERDTPLFDQFSEKVARALKVKLR